MKKEKDFDYLFQAVGELEEEHSNSMSWHLAKGVEEAEERQLEYDPDPNFGQLKRLLEENIDSFLNSLTIFYKAGVDPAVIVNMALAKIITVRERHNNGYYDTVQMKPEIEYSPPFADTQLD